MTKTLLCAICLVLIINTKGFSAYLPEHLFDVGLEVFEHSYEEPGVMEQSGLMNGMFFTYTYRKEAMFRLEGTLWSYGEVDYTSPISGELQNIENMMYEIRLVWGRDFSLSQTTFFTPFFGFGYRHLKSNASNKISTAGHYGYERESTYIYSPVGIETFIDLAENWSLGFILEYELFLQGQQISHLSDVNSGYSDVTNKQTDGYGYRLCAKIRRRGAVFDILIEPYIRYWDIERSDIADVTYYYVVVGRGYEPENSTTEAGLRAAVSF